jgi:hypothetical protein
MVRSLAVIGIALGVLVPAAVAANPAAVTIDTRKPALADAGKGKSTASVVFTNLTRAPIGVSITSSTGGADCEPELAPPTLAQEEETKVTATFLAPCKIDKKTGIVFVVSAGDSIFRVTAAPEGVGRTGLDRTARISASTDRLWDTRGRVCPEMAA